MKFTIPQIPPSLNKYAGRKNVWEYRADKQEWKDLVCLYSKRPKEPYKKAIVTITYFFKTKARHDPDNYIKFVMDGLTAAGIIQDDSFDCIKLILEGGYDKHNPRTEVEVIEC
jgi:Holliday junction resolvase RusA-like endonuclease